MVQATKESMAKAAVKEDWEPQYLQNHRIETFKSSMSLSTEIFKYLTLLNGGAVAGMLTTLDKLAKVLSVTTIRISVGCFIFGLVLNGFAIFALYFSQTVVYSKSMTKPDKKTQNGLFFYSAAYQIFSLSFFCFGAIFAMVGLHL
jgi:hypothetical protein